jgi:hypothetical protein
MEASGNSASGAIAGRNHQAALAQPQIDLNCRQVPHSSVIRCQPSTVPSKLAEPRKMPFVAFAPENIY